MKLTHLKRAALLATCLLAAGCETINSVPPNNSLVWFADPVFDKYNKWTCFSANEACGKIPMPAPVTKPLAGPLNGDVARGKQAFVDRARGNCLACHHMLDGTQAGNGGPDLSTFGSWQRSDADAYALIYDIRSRNPASPMPLFGVNEIINEQEIRDIVAYLQSAK
jgi:sulfur oxidation c-type cytochrome SoxX